MCLALNFILETKLLRCQKKTIFQNLYEDHRNYINIRFGRIYRSLEDFHDSRIEQQEFWPFSIQCWRALELQIESR